MRVLITGVTSFLGLYTAKLLLQEGHEVIGAVRPGSRRAQELDAHGISAYPTYRTVHLDLSELPEAELGETHYAEVLGLDQVPATPDRSAEPAGHSGTAAVMQVAVAVPARSSAPAVTAPPSATHLPLPALADDPAPLIDAWIHFAWDGVGSAGRSDTNIQI